MIIFISGRPTIIVIVLTIFHQNTTRMKRAWILSRECGICGMEDEEAEERIYRIELRVRNFGLKSANLGHNMYGSRWNDVP